MDPNVMSNSKPELSGADIQSGLVSLGLSEGDVVFLHSSLSAFGYVHGGADTVIDAFQEILGASGILAMPTFTWGDFHADPVVEFDLRKSPCETGRIPETFRRRDGVLRSVHVCHSVAASGDLASEVLGDGVSSFGPGSSFDKLLKLNAWIILLGVTFQSCTALHAVEEFVGVPYRKHRDFQGSTVILADGSQIPSRSIEYLRQDGSSNDFAKVETLLDKQGVLHQVQIGNSRCTSVRIRDLFRIVRPLLERDSRFLSKSRSNH